MTDSCSCENQRLVLNPILTRNYVNWFSLCKLGRELGEDLRTAQHQYRYPESLIHPHHHKKPGAKPFFERWGREWACVHTAQALPEGGPMQSIPVMPLSFITPCKKNSLHLKPAQHFIVCNSKFTVEIHQNRQGVHHTVALSFTLKSTLRQKKNYGNSNISPCKNIIFKKSSKRNQSPSRYYNSITNLRF